MPIIRPRAEAGKLAPSAHAHAIPLRMKIAYGLHSRFGKTSQVPIAKGQKKDKDTTHNVPQA